MKRLLFLILMCCNELCAQNILQNPGFEEPIFTTWLPECNLQSNNTSVPYTRPPFNRIMGPWQTFKQNRDMFFHSSRPTDFHFGICSGSCFTGDCDGINFISGNRLPTPTYLQEQYIGLEGSGSSRIGISQKLPCELNEGEYKFAFDFALDQGSNKKIKLRLSDKMDSDGKEYLTFKMNSSCNWSHHEEVFTFNKVKNKKIQYLHLLSTGGGECYKYSFFLDNIVLTRPCDEANPCSRTAGIICETIVKPSWDFSEGIFKILNIDNVSKIEFSLFNVNSQLVYSENNIEPNGFIHDFYWNGRDKFGNQLGLAEDNYEFKITLINDCGSKEISWNQDLLQKHNIPNLPSFTDHPTWTKTPIECCVQDLVIPDNTVLTGDIVLSALHSITIGNNVSVSLGSHVILRAPTISASQNFTALPETELNPNVACRRAPQQNKYSIEGLSFYTPPDTTDYEEEIDEYEEKLITEEIKLENIEPLPKPTNSASLNISPNPFSTSTTFNFSLPTSNLVHIRITDTLGVLVYESKNQYEAGEHSLEWDASKVPSGVYFVQFQTGDFVQVKKIVKN